MPTVKVNNININYKVVGYGEPLIMIMGLSADQSGWNSQVPYFKKHYQVITFDNRGCGKSDKPKGPYTMKMMADDTIELMNHLGIEKAHMMGISMGGMIAQEIAINYPQRVMKLILASTYARVDDKLNGPTLELTQAVQSSRRVGTVLINLAFNKPVNRFFIILLARIRSKFTRASVKAANKVGLLGQLAACMKQDTLDRLSLIKAPTLVIMGKADRVIKPTSSEVIAEKIPNARLVKIENGSHVLNIEIKREFNRIVWDFLKDQGAGT
jgi:pimeloyl-ACP methyl ester carboxylesterase